ncbi:MAG: TRAP transporter small permease [Spirochaetia bacterium]|nr:TRAP transporter small permease [Spirochaetia bacterium]
MYYTTLQKGCGKARRILQKGEMLIGAACLAVMLVMMLLNIFFRYILSKPIYYSDELNNYLFIWMSFLSAAYVMGNDGHVRVTAIVSLLPKRGQLWIKVVMDLIMVVVFFQYIAPSLRMLSRLKLSNMMRIPLKYVYVIMPIVFLLMCIHILVNVIEEFTHLALLKQEAAQANGGA